MIVYSEEYGKLNIRQCQVEGWADGIYNTHISYDGTILAIDYHRHATNSRKIIPATALYNLTNGLKIIPQCNLFKGILDDIFFLKMKIAMKVKNGTVYNFNQEFADSVLRDTVNAINDNIKNIYMNLQFEAMAKGRKFFIPLPDYTSQSHDVENISENESSTDIAVKNDKPDETFEMIRQTKENTDLLIKLAIESQYKNNTIPLIKEIIEALQLDPEPKDGKYLPASGDYKQFVYWIVDNNYDEFLNQDNFFTFIYCDIKEETIKKYFRDARDSRK